MYRRFVERRVRETFQRLGEGDWQAQVRQMPPELARVFPGDHALGGVRRTPEGMRRWFERLYAIFPDLGFEVNRVLVRGWPWGSKSRWSGRTAPPRRTAFLASTRARTS